MCVRCAITRRNACALSGQRASLRVVNCTVCGVLCDAVFCAVLCVRLRRRACPNLDRLGLPLLRPGAASRPDYEAIIKLADGFNGADLRNVCTEAGMMAIREERAYVIHEDFMKAVRKMTDMKKLEGTLDYKKV